MGLTVCRECGTNVSSKAGKCPSCGIKNPAKSKHVLSIICGLIGGIVVSFFVIAVLENSSGNSSKAKSEVISHSLTSDVFLVNGEPDAGFRQRVRVRNNGSKGEIECKVHLSTSEGEFNRLQKVTLDAGEEYPFSFTFHEPSINAENVQYEVICKP